MSKLFPRYFLGLSLGIISLAGAVAISGCHKGVEPAAIPDNSGPDPTDANMAPVDNSQPQAAPVPAPQSRVLGVRSQAQPQQSTEQYAPPAASQPPQNEAYAAAQTAQPPADYDDNYNYNAPPSDDQVDAGQQAIEEANQPPPPLPVYQQP